MKRIIDISESLYGRVKEKLVALSDIPVLCKAVDDSKPYTDPTEALDFKEEIIRMVNMGVYPEAIIEWVRESEAENEANN